MRIHKIAHQRMYGYKAIGVNEQDQGYSLYGGSECPIDLKIGSWMKNCPTPNGFYLGSTKQYVLDYYSGLTDDKELLLTYEFDKLDLLSGDLEASGGTEYRVSKARLLDTEEIPK